jgi:antitoxin (DNA-binding transcriptional repressor) of toxin-antitoxin stability system
MGRFKRDCLKILGEMSSTPEPVIITKRGKPIAKLVRPDAQTSDDIFGCMRGQIKIVGDIVSPAVPLEDWEFLK